MPVNASGREHSDAPTMDVVDAAALRYDEFCERYMGPNRPVLLRNVGNRWCSQAKHWTRRAETGGLELDFEFLADKYGHADVPVVDGDVVEYGSEERTTMRFAEYLELLKNREAGKRYLKDWHFVHAFSQEELYTTPTFFEDDWLNWWWDHKDSSQDDYRFIYLGPAGSWTPMHHDVFRSYSWSVNVYGRKEWIFFHPDDEPKLKDAFGRFVIPDVTASDIDRKKFPRVNEAAPIRVIQEAGDAIFVPSGWYHQVKNLEDTMSINHNWFNGYNLSELWSFFQREYAAVEAELEDLKELGMNGAEFREQCQIVMNANTGINYREFQALLLAKERDLAGKAEDLAITDTNSIQSRAATQQLEVVREILSELQQYFDQQ